MPRTPPIVASSARVISHRREVDVDVRCEHRERLAGPCIAISASSPCGSSTRTSPAQTRVEVRPHLAGVGGVDDQQPAVGQAIEDHVVVRAAGVVGEDVVARLQRLHRRDVIDGQRIGPRRDVVAAQFELRHVREIEQPGALAHGVVFGAECPRTAPASRSRRTAPCVAPSARCASNSAVRRSGSSLGAHELRRTRRPACASSRRK